MNNEQNSSLRQSLKVLLILTLISSCVFTLSIGTHTTRATQASESELIARANAAIAGAENAGVLAQRQRLIANDRLEQLKRFNSTTEPDRNSLTALRQVTTTVSEMFDETTDKALQQQLVDAQKTFVDALKELNDSMTALQAATTSPKIEAAKAAVKNKVDAIKPRFTPAGDGVPELSGMVTSLNEALGAVYKTVAKLAANAGEGLEPFTRTFANQEELFNTLQKKISDVPAIIDFNLALKEGWTGLSTELSKVVSNHGTQVEAPDTAIQKLHNKVASVISGLNLQITTLSEIAKSRQSTLGVTKQAFKTDPPLREREAIQSIQDAQRTADAVERIVKIVEGIVLQSEAAGITFNKADTQTAITALTKNVVDLRSLTTLFEADLSGDRSLWVTEKIRLYYFTDIPRLVRTLNPDAALKGGDADGRRRADTRLEELRAAEDAQSEASGTASSLKRRVATIRRQLQEARDQLDAANILAERTASRDEELKRRPEGSVPAERTARSAEERNKREEDRVAAQERFDKLNDENKGLAAQLTEAEAQLEAAQLAFERASNRTLRATQSESAAFANLRDNAPFWFAEAVSTSTDPARRVQISSSSGGENAIFIRGRKDDIVKVQDIVAKLDEPAPQARMTLWKIELNSDATPKGAERFNKALAIVEEELATTRANIADTLALLLGSVSEEADYASTTSTLSPASVKKDCHEKREYAKYFPNVGDTDLTGRYQRLRRYSLYSPQVRRELGIEFLDELGFDNPKQFGLKDPASATTLNEALIIMLMTDSVHRQRIMGRFLQGLTKFDPQNPQKTQFTRLASMLRDAPTHSSTKLETTRQQQELIYAIRNPLLKHLVGRIARLQARVKDFKALHVVHNGTNASASAAQASEEVLYKCLQEKLPKIFDTIHDEFLISPVDILSGDVKLVDSGDGTIGLQLPTGFKTYNLRPSPARVAAADGMLDVYTKAFEDDIDRVFVQPMLVRLREKLKKTGIGFGVIQRTSVLATNRLVARVDPRATAELSVGEETNLIQGLQSIAQIALASQSGGVLGGLGQLKLSANEKDAAEIYGITSGSAFQVTPIFDPTGQALRFKFDFVDATLVREPRGTVNPQIPRVQRHTVNTEVQLGNLEIREVSRFESDSKIGLPTTYWGGLPLLKDIPGVRPIPLIGWFVRRKGSNAIAQRSLIFAQTTMSPTIGDILDLFDTSLQRR
jgi:hypothetical protein